MTAAPPQRRFGPVDLAIVVVMNVMWGLNIIAVKMAVMEIAPLTAAALRQAIVLLFCAGSLRLVRGRMRALIALGILSGGLFYIAVNLSLAVAHNVGALAIAGQLGVPFSLLLAVVIHRERIHAARIAGMALSFAGVGVLVFDPAIAEEGLGLVLSIIGSAIWAVCSLIQRELKGVPILTIYAWVGLCGVAVLAPIAWVFEPAAVAAVPDLRLGALGWVAFSALGSTVVGQGAMVWLLRHHPVTVVTPLTLAAPVISVFAAAYWFATPLSLAMLAGGAMAMAGVAVVTIRTARVRDRT